MNVSPLGGFVSCEPIYDVGERIVADVLLAPDKEAGIRLVGSVSRVNQPGREDTGALGVAVNWSDAGSQASAQALQHFLHYVLGIADATIRADGKGAYPYRYRFEGAPAPQAATPGPRPLTRPGGAPYPDPTADAPAGGRADTARRSPGGASRPFAAQRVASSSAPVTEPSEASSGARVPVSGPAPSPIASASAGGAGSISAPEPQPEPPDLSEPASEGGADAERGASGVRGERRGRPRLNLSVPVTYFIGSTPHVGRARDASRSGIYIETDQPPPDVGNRVTIRLPVMHAGRYHVVMLTAEVVRQRASREKPGTHGGFGAKYIVVDELGNPGIFGHFLASHTVSDG